MGERRSRAAAWNSGGRRHHLEAAGSGVVLGMEAAMRGGSGGAPLSQPSLMRETHPQVKTGH